MRPLRLRLEGFRSFGELDLELPAGCVSLTGDNGAGKSSVVDAIDVALFGPDGRSWEPYVGPHGEMLVELELDHRGDRYRVRRTAGKRATLDLEMLGPEWHVEPDGHGDPIQVQSPADWEPLTAGSIADTQTELERLLGLSRETFRASALLRQGAGGAFTEATPKDRKRILANALALNEWAAAGELAAIDRRAAERKVAENAGAVRALHERLDAADGLDEHVAETRRLHAEHAARLEQLAADRVAKAERVEALAREAERRDTVERELGQARREFDRLSGERDAQAVARTERDHLEPQLGPLRERVERLKELRAAVTEGRVANERRAAVLREREAAERDLKAAHDEDATLAARQERTRAADADATCDTCGQRLDVNARAATIAHLHEQRTDLHGVIYLAAERLAGIVVPDEVDVATLKAELDTLHGTDEKLEAVVRRLAVVIVTLERPAPSDTDVAGAAAEVVALETRLAAIPAPEGLAAARHDLDDLTATETNERRAYERRAHELGALEQRLKDADHDRRTLAQLNAGAAELAEHVADLETLEQAFGRDGVPAWIVEHHALPAIEAEANRLLTVLGGPVDRVELRTERELKTGGVRDDALDIVCATRDGDRDYATFSGGERTRVNLALRIALARLLAHRRDADVRMLAIDEPDGLDEQGMSALVDVLRDLVQRGEFDTTLLASHVPALRDAFDTAIVVERGPAGSTAGVA